VTLLAVGWEAPNIELGYFVHTLSISV